MKKDKQEVPLTNRERARNPRGRSFWCGCDMRGVWAGQKCSTCGRRNGKKRWKAGKIRA